jgi:phosphatidylinositol kinase/protein kinase (PI-3  family)
MITGNFNEHAQNLADATKGALQIATVFSTDFVSPTFMSPSAGIDFRLKVATEIRDSIEIVHTSEYANFLSAFFSVFAKILQQGRAHFKDCPEQKLRNVLLEILNRLPHNETLRPYVTELLNLSMHVLNNDNEENSLICLRIIFDLHKNYRPTLDQFAQPFLSFVRKLYHNFKDMVQANFGSGGGQVPANMQAAQAQAQAQAAQAQAAKAQAAAAQATPAQAPALQAAAAAAAATAAKAAATAQAAVAAHAATQAQSSSIDGGIGGGLGGEKPKSGVLVRSTDSFKVLIECPLIVMFLFQLYPKYIQQNIQVLLPLMVASIDPSSPANAGIAGFPVRHASVMQDYVAAQVKTVYFLSYLLRQFSDIMRPHQDAIPKAVVNLLRTCPGDAIAIRKELLVATRHILATDFRTGFFGQIEVLLDEKVLVGEGRPALQTLRPFAYHFLAELVHHVRLELKIPQLSKIIFMFSLNVHDPTLSYSMQTTSIKLLLNLIEGIIHRNDSEGQGRVLLVRIMDTIVNKFVTLKERIPKLLETYKAHAPPKQGEKPADESSQKVIIASEKEADSSDSTNATDGSLKEINDCKVLIRTLILGLKTVVWSASNLRTAQNSAAGQPAPTTHQQVRKGLTKEECLLISRLLKGALKCFPIYSAVASVPASEEKDMLDLFAQVFTVLEVRNFQDIISVRMQTLFDHMVENQAMLTIPQHFLANANISKHFAEILLNFLVDRMELLGKVSKETDATMASVLLRLFKIVFASVTLFPDNEPVLQPHLAKIVTSSLTHATEMRDALNYLHLLRALFKSIATGKFELLYKEFTPLLQPLLQGFLLLQKGPFKQDMSDLIVELCLSVPARPSSILPYLHLLMRPVVCALHSSSEQLVSLGLRTLEFWIDNLQPDFLEPLMNTVMPELMLAIWKHLRPSPYIYGPVALRILGKLGGRNRNCIRSPLELPCKENPENGLRLVLTFEPGIHFMLPVDEYLPLATAGFRSTNIHVFYKKEALNLLRACLAPVLNVKDCSIADQTQPGVSAVEVKDDGASAESSHPKACDGIFKTRSQHNTEIAMAQKILSAVFVAATDKDLEQLSLLFLRDLCHHFALLFCMGKGRQTHTLPTRAELPPTLFLEVINENLCSETEKLSEVAVQVLRKFTDTMVALGGEGCGRDGNKTPNFVFNELVDRLCHCLYERGWENKCGGCRGLLVLCERLPKPWLRIQQAMMVKGLVFVIKDLAPDLDSVTCQLAPDLYAVTVTDALQTLTQILTLCNSDLYYGALYARIPEERTIENIEQAFSDKEINVISAHNRHILQAQGAQIQDRSTQEKIRVLLPLIAQEKLVKPRQKVSPADDLEDPKLGPDDGHSGLNDVVFLLVSELANVKPQVREVAQTSLRKIAELHSKSVRELMSIKSCRDAFHRLVFSKPLKAMTPAQSMGVVHALTFALSLRPYFLEISGEMVQMLKDAVAIIEKPTTTVQPRSTIQIGGPDKEVHQTQLCKCCIEFLCAAMTYSDSHYQRAELLDLRNHIIRIFFTSLQTPYPEIVGAAKGGLGMVIKQQKLPKELLQTCLRPILTNLSDYRKLSVTYLQGLSRLLELLSNWFNATLGEKLIEHLKKWTEPDFAQKKIWPPGEEIKIAAAIINLFHLLPSAASKFLEQLVSLVMKIETMLPGTQHETEMCSPYRGPLVEYINRYATESVDFFLARLRDPQYRGLFQAVLRSQLAGPLRDELAKSTDSIIKHTFNSALTGAEKQHMQFQGVLIVHTLAKFKKGWLGANKVIFDQLITMWRSPERQARLNQEEHLPIDQLKESKLIVKCFLIYCAEEVKEIDVLFDMMTIFSVRTLADFTFLKDFYQTIAKQYSSGRKRDILNRFLRMFEHASVAHDNKVQALQLLIIPMLEASFQMKQGHEVLNVQASIALEVNEANMALMKRSDDIRSALAEGINKALQTVEPKSASSTSGSAPPQTAFPPNDLVNMHHVRPNKLTFDVRGGNPDVEEALKRAVSIENKAGHGGLAALGDVKEITYSTPLAQSIVSQLLDPPETSLQAYDELLRSELLQLATLMIRYMPNQLVQHRKELIKFGWNHLKREDTTSKQWAFVNVCRFFEAYQAPDKIILQVYVALLRACHSEAKSLVRQALDILTPALPKRLPPGEHKYPIWIRYTKKILVEEGHSLPHLVHIWQLLVRHADNPDFYASRAQFVPQMVNSLNRLGAGTSCPPENRKLAIDLAEMMIKWEKRRMADAKQAIDVKRKGDKQDASNKRVKTEDGAAFAGQLGSPKLSPAPTMNRPGMYQGGGGPHGGGDDEFRPNSAMVEMVVNFLIKVAFMSLDIFRDASSQQPYSAQAAALPPRCQDLINQALEIWPEANVKLHYFEKVLQQSNDQASTLTFGMRLFNIILKHQLSHFVMNNIAQIQNILQPCLTMENGCITDFCEFLTKILAAFPYPCLRPDVQNLYNKIMDLIDTSLRQLEKVAMYNSLTVLKTICGAHEQFLDKLAPQLVKVVQKLAKDNLSAQMVANKRNDGPAENSTSTGALITSIKLLSSRIHALNDLKKAFLQNLLLIIDKSTDVPLLMEITKIVGGWMSTRPGDASSTVLNVKEKTNFVLKMAAFENIPSVHLQVAFLDIVHRLYNETPGTSSRSELLPKLERAFMIGLRSSEPPIRAKFFDLFNRSIVKNLYKRLLYIVQGQDWESLSDSFWLKQALDLLLAVLVQNRTLQIAPGGAKVPALKIEPDDMRRSNKESKDKTNVDQVLGHQIQFLQGMKRLDLSCFLRPLRELAHRDSNIAYKLWVLAFPVVWMNLTLDEQKSLMKPMTNLLSKEYHQKQMMSPCNVIQALLEGVSHSRPPIKLPPELVRHLGKAYNAWHIAVPLLEGQMGLAQSGMEEKSADALSDLYKQLSEEDAWCGLWKRRCAAEETKLGFVMQQLGQYQDAQKIYYNAMSTVHNNKMNEKARLSKAEFDLWEDQYVACAKRLNQWDQLTEFARSVSHSEILSRSAMHVELLHECLWRVPDWNGMKDWLNKPMLLDSNSPQLKLYHMYVALQDNKLTEVEQLSGQAVQLVLKQWVSLPDTGIHTFIPLLEIFQQFVELQESAKILDELNNSTRNITLTEQSVSKIKNILSTWQERLPNQWDSITVWDELLTWRRHVFTIIASAFHNLKDVLRDVSPALTTVGINETAWSLNKMANIARYQGAPEVCLVLLANSDYHQLQPLTNNAQFARLREQALAFLQIPNELQTGLNVLNQVNIETFSPRQQAEIFILKADFVRQLKGRSEAAFAAYSGGMSICADFEEGWLAWGSFCDEIVDKITKGDPSAPQAKPDDAETPLATWTKHALVCYLQALRYGSDDARMKTPRILWLLGYDKAKGPVHKSFEKYNDFVAPGVWLPWIPQLISGLSRPEQLLCKNVLLRLVKAFPQAVYYGLRSFIVSNSSVLMAHQQRQRRAAQQRYQHQMQQQQQAAAKAKAAGEPPPKVEPPKVEPTPEVQVPPHLVLAIEVMSELRRERSTVASDLDVLLTSIGRTMQTTPEERLYGAVCSVLTDTCMQYAPTKSDEVPERVSIELERICRRHFPPPSDPSSGASDHVRQRFIKDFNDTDAVTLSEVINRLRKWQNHLKGKVELLQPTQKLEKISQSMADFQNSEVELPGQYLQPHDPVPDQHIKLERLGMDVAIVRRGLISQRRIEFLGSDGRDYHFVIECQVRTYNQTSDEIMLQLVTALNEMMDRYKETRRRCSQLCRATTVPVDADVRLVEDSPWNVSLLDVYEQHCERTNKDPGHVTNVWRERTLAAVIKGANKEELLETKITTIKEICKSTVPDSVFSHYMYKTLPRFNALWSVVCNLTPPSLLVYLRQPVKTRHPTRY